MTGVRQERRGTLVHAFLDTLAEAFFAGFEGWREYAVSFVPTRDALCRVDFYAPAGWSLAADEEHGVVLKSVYGETLTPEQAVMRVAKGGPWRHQLEAIEDFTPDARD